VSIFFSQIGNEATFLYSLACLPLIGGKAFRPPIPTWTLRQFSATTHAADDIEGRKKLR
jgi:hypothetical protein